MEAILGINPIVLVILIAWIGVWKGLALWKAARKNSIPWFVVLLIINTIGILEILYIFLFSEIKVEKPVKASTKKKRI